MVGLIQDNMKIEIETFRQTPIPDKHFTKEELIKLIQDSEDDIFYIDRITFSEEYHGLKNMKIELVGSKII